MDEVTVIDRARALPVGQSFSVDASGISDRTIRAVEDWSNILRNGGGRVIITVDHKARQATITIVPEEE